jgi:hypothetical protein
MGKGLGPLQQLILEALPELVRPAVVNIGGVQRHVECIRSIDLYQTIGGDLYDHSLQVCLSNAVRGLERKGRVATFKLMYPGKKGNRATLFIEYLQ